MDKIKFEKSEKIEEIKKKYKLLTLMGNYFPDVPVLESPLNALEIMKLVKEILIDKEDWYLLIRPRIPYEQYNIFVNEVFRDFPKTRICIDVGAGGQFTLSQVLSYTDLCVVGSSSVVFEALKMNVPTVQMHFEKSEPHYPMLARNGLTYEVTDKNREEFKEMFIRQENGIDDWVEKNKPHNKNWKYYVERGSQTFADKLVKLLNAF